jgi:glutathione synthase
VITDDERNVIDQKIMEYELQATYKINSMRCTLEQIGEEAEFDQNNHVLRLRGKEIGFVYYRSGY